jgi:hypothetical protein
MKKTCRTGRNSHQTATDFNTEAASIQAAIRRDNLMAVWWLFVLEFQFSLGASVQITSGGKTYLVALFVQFLVAVLMAVRFNFCAFPCDELQEWTSPQCTQTKCFMRHFAVDWDFLQMLQPKAGGRSVPLRNTWRRERDSNPRSPFRLSGFQDRLFQPLTHPSA